jgi:hypothetical protein
MNNLNSFFNIRYGQKEYHNKENLEEGDILLISSQGTNNGGYGFFNIPYHFNPPIVTVPSTGSICESFVQTQKCCVDDNCLVLIPKQKTSLEYLYYISAKIRETKWRYVYGRQVTPRRLGTLQVIPPDEFKSKIKFDILIKKIIPKDVKKDKITIKEVNAFPIKQLCNIERKYAPYLNQIDLSKKVIPYVTTTEWDNGISVYCNEEPNFMRGSVTISLDGSCGITFYQFDDFLSGEKTAVLTLKKIKNSYLLMYIANLIRIKSWRYHYGRKLSMGRLEKFELPLPVNSKGEIDLDTVKKIVKNTYGSEIFEKYAIK